MGKSILMLMIVLTAILPSAAYTEGNVTIEELDLSTGESFTDIGIPIPSFTIEVESPDTADNLKYFFGMKQQSSSNFMIKTIRLYIVLLIFMLFVVIRLSRPVIIKRS